MSDHYTPCFSERPAIVPAQIGRYPAIHCSECGREVLPMLAAQVTCGGEACRWKRQTRLRKERDARRKR